MNNMSSSVATKVSRLPTPRKSTGVDIAKNTQNSLEEGMVERVKNSQKLLEEEMDKFFEDTLRPGLAAVSSLDQEVNERGCKDLELVVAWARKQEEHVKNKIEANKMEVNIPFTTQKLPSLVNRPPTNNAGEDPGEGA